MAQRPATRHTDKASCSAWRKEWCRLWTLHCQKSWKYPETL